MKTLHNGFESVGGIRFITVEITVTQIYIADSVG